MYPKQVIIALINDFLNAKMFARQQYTYKPVNKRFFFFCIDGVVSLKNT